MTDVASMTVVLRNYVGGEWRGVEGVEGVETLRDIDPATGEVVAEVPLSGTAEVREAVEAARAAQPAWRDVPPQRRARAVLALRDGLLAFKLPLTLAPFTGLQALFAESHP